MDYTLSKRSFQILKSIRYIKLYGLRRTFVKVKGQFHMKRTFPNISSSYSKSIPIDRTKIVIGVIGSGNFSFSCIAFYADKLSHVFVKSVMDVDLNRAKSLADSYQIPCYTDNFLDILQDQDIDLVFIASNHRSHAEYAVPLINAGKRVHIEKPHVVTHSQLDSLTKAIVNNPASSVFLGFNRPKSILFKKLLNYLQCQSGPLMINWFIAGHHIPSDHWYFEEREGGRVLGNLCHCTDLTLHLVGITNAFPCTITSCSPVDSSSDFVFNFLFADNSVATISFSAKGHTFEGVREILNVHRGDLLATLTDFQSLKVDINSKKIDIGSRHRDHGHKANIVNSIVSNRGETLEYIRMSALLFLSARESLVNSSSVVVRSVSDV